jgi:hypothetical protein
MAFDELVELWKRERNGAVAIASGAGQSQTKGADQLSKLQTPEPAKSVEAIMARNFLGAEAWKKLGVIIDEPLPPIPKWITPQYLSSPCPLHKGLEIRHSHILVLVPKNIQGQPFTALALEQLCHSKQTERMPLVVGEGDVATLHSENQWIQQSSDQSYWVLMAKSDPVSGIVPAEKTFKGKSIADMHQVCRRYYPEYAHGSALEMMTGILLNAVVNGERLYRDVLALCRDKTDDGEHVSVGHFYGPEDGIEYSGLAVIRQDTKPSPNESYALVRV